ncbi:MAG: ABC transporter permease, partial [Lachnospiraceae bacterium]|nr:ABC transporter permease [Lachnospiraceae bacterium]
MNVINKLVKKTLKLNKKRSIGTIIGIMLSVALVCAVSGMFASLRATIINFEKTYSGDYHFCYVNIDADTVETLKHNRDIEKLETTGRLGFCMPKDTFIEINSVNDIDNTVIPLKLVDGRMPENNHEIVLDEMALWQLDAKVGDTVTLDIGEAETSIDEDDIFHAEIVAPVSYEYKIVGKVAGDAYYTGYTVDTDNGVYDAYISFKNPKNYRESIRNILGYNLGDEEEEPYMASYVNAELLRWINMEFSDDTMRMLYNVIAVLIAIILITSVFCIKNSLDISVTEKMKTYGMLASVGATKKQIRRSVLFEGAYLGMIGIPFGIVLGETAVYVLCKIVGYFMQYLYNGSEGVDMICAMPLLPIILSVAVGVLTIYLSTIMAA